MIGGIPLPQVPYHHFTPQQRQSIHHQLQKQDNLKRQSNNLDMNLMDLSQQQSQYQKLIKIFRQGFNQQNERQLIDDRSQSITQHYTQLLTINEQITHTEDEILSIRQQLLQETTIEITQEIDSQRLRTSKELLGKSIEATEKGIDDVRRKLDQMNHQVGKRARGVQVEEKVEGLVTELQAENRSGQNEVQVLLQEDVRLIHALEFDQLSLNVLQEIITKKQHLKDLNYELLSLKSRYFTLQINMQSNDELCQQLLTHQTQHSNLSQDLQEIREFNQNLEQNMERQIAQQVDEKVNALNEVNFVEVNKYLKASHYVLKKFEALIEDVERGEFYEEVKKLVREMEQKKLA